PIHFMPTEVSDDTKYINRVSTYILRITGSLINGQKAVVNITGIRPFFDAEVPENYSPSSFKTILARILSITLKSSVQTRKPFITDTRYQFGLSDIRFEI